MRKKKKNLALHDFFTCLQEVPFSTTFYKSPVVILSVNHEYNLKVKGSRAPENNIKSAWIEVGFNLYSKVRKKQTLFRATPLLFFSTSAEIAYWWFVTTQIWACSSSDWLKKISLAVRPIRSSILIWEVLRHQYGISSLVPQTSFQGKTSN